MNCKGFLQSVLICLLSVAVLCAAPNLDKGKSIFKDNCGTCHNKNMKDDMTGPALGGVQERWAGYPKEDLYKWIRNSQSMVSAGHPEATKLFQKWKTTMTAFPTLSDEDLENLLGYIEAVNKGTYGPKVEVPGQAVSGANTSKESGFSWWMYGIFGLLGIIALFLWNIISELNYSKSKA
ncbi:MAG: cytochrome c, partial [Saprospiraceae bacterium]